ncbi:MAG: hypothetical protein Q9218_006824 [Villophora microphyllina]
MSGHSPGKHGLSSSSSPAGPEDFHITPHIFKEPVFLPRDRLFLFVANIIAIELLQGDFNSNFSGRIVKIHEMRNPGLRFKASINVPSLQIPRRFIYWGLVRMMDRFIREGSYENSYYPMTWKGRYAGIFGIDFGGFEEHQLNEQLNITASDDAQVKAIQVPGTPTVNPILTYDPRVTTKSEFYGSVRFNPVDLWMSVIGALVQVAELPDNRNISSFGGGFPTRYKVLQAAWSALSPPPTSAVAPLKLNRSLLSGVVVDFLIMSQLQDDFRQMRMRIWDQGQLVVEGGDFPLPANAVDPGTGVDTA